MKPIFSTEQARYQKFASFFIVALGCFARLRESMRDAQTFGDQGSAFGNRHLLKKVDQNFHTLVQLSILFSCHP